MLGGTRFVGRHIVAKCLTRDYEVTVLHRGLSPSPFGGVVRHVFTDRRAPTAEATAVLAEPWDAVIDTSARDVEDLTCVSAPLPNVGRYVFVSTCGVYSPAAAEAELTERSATIVADGMHPARKSATGKIRCERWLRAHCEALGVPLLIARLGLVVGRFDYSQRLAYWLERALRGGDILVPMDPGQPIQLLDASDVATFLLNAVDRGLSGVINVSGPQTTAEQLLDPLLTLSGQAAQPCWVGEDYALAAGVRPWTEVPLWVPKSSPELALMAVDSSRARNAGLACRPLGDTVADCLAWQATQREWSRQWLDPAHEQRLLRQWRG